MTGVDFDMYYSETDFSAISDIWLDLIIKTPMMNKLVIKDVVVSRHPRADV